MDQAVHVCPADDDVPSLEDCLAEIFSCDWLGVHLAELSLRLIPKLLSGIETWADRRPGDVVEPEEALRDAGSVWAGVVVLKSGVSITTNKMGQFWVVIACSIYSILLRRDAISSTWGKVLKGDRSLYAG